MNFVQLESDAALEQDSKLIDSQTVSDSLIVKEVQAWRLRFPNAIARVNNELDFWAQNQEEPIITADENLIWRRLFLNFKFRPQDDCIALR